MQNFNIDSARIDIQCPGCKVKALITLEAVVGGSSIRCKSCQKTIELVDQDGSIRKSVESVNQAQNKLRKKSNKVLNISLDLKL